jgi:hypothetical protein
MAYYNDHKKWKLKGGLDVGLAIVNNLAHKLIWRICGNSRNHTYDNSFNIYYVFLFSYLATWDNKSSWFFPSSQTKHISIILFIWTQSSSWHKWLIHFDYSQNYPLSIMTKNLIKFNKKNHHKNHGFILELKLWHSCMLAPIQIVQLKVDE